MDFKPHITKAITLMVVALLFLSFKASYWEFDKKYIVKIQKSIDELFGRNSYNFEEFKNFQENFYTIKEADIVLGYFIEGTSIE